MKKKDVKVGSIYAVKVSGTVVPVKLVSESPYGGWNGKSLVTGRNIRVKTGGRLRRELTSDYGGARKAEDVRAEIASDNRWIEI